MSTDKAAGVSQKICFDVRIVKEEVVLDVEYVVWYRNDKVVWSSMFTVMCRRKGKEGLYCSVAATYDKNGPDGWLYGKPLDDYLQMYRHDRIEYEKVRAIENTIMVFGKENVRAYVRGIPDVFGDGTIEDVKWLMYPYDQPGWDIPEFTANGVVREGRGA